MRIFSELKTLGYLGAVESPSLTVDMDAATLMNTASNSSGVVRLGSDNKSTLILKPQLDTTKRLFQGANCGYESANGQTIVSNNAVQEFPSTVELATNQPFYISLMMFTDTSKADSFTDVRVGFGKWRLLHYNGSLNIAYINENWNLTQETLALQGNTDLQGPRTKNGDDIGMPDAIFDIFQQVNLNDSAQGAVAGAYTYLWIIPQPGMGLNIATGRTPFTPKADDVDVIEMPEWLASQTVISGGAISVYTKSTSFTIDGYALKFADAALLAGPFSNGAINDLVGDLTWNVNKDEPGGTSVTTEERSLGYTTWAIRTELHTDSNHIYTPFVYRVSASNPGGTFENIATNQYDSTVNLDAMGNPPILDIDMQCEGEMRRHTYDVSLRFAGDMLAQLTQKSALIDNQLVNLKMGLSMASLNPIITGGMIDGCGAFDTSTMDEDGIMHPWTTMRGTAKDKWAICEDQILDKVLPGDDLRLGAYLIYVLGVIGFKSSEIAINPNTGIRLFKAQFGEQPIVMPRDNQSGADYLRELMDCYGFSLAFYVGADGKWYLEDTPSTLATVGNVPAEFSSSAARNNNETYPGRLAILGMSGPDWIRDSRDFYNALKAEGGVVRGNQLVSTYIDQRSIYDPTAPNFIGRFKPMPTVRNDAWRTEDILIMVVRSLAMRYAISSRMYQFSTYFHIELFTNDKVKLETTSGGKLCRIKNIGSASIANDNMSIVAQEIQ